MYMYMYIVYPHYMYIHVQCIIESIWFYYSRMPVTKKSFRVYRILGKGGFGLVSVGDVVSCRSWSFLLASSASPSLSSSPIVFFSFTSSFSHLPTTPPSLSFSACPLPSPLPLHLFPSSLLPPSSLHPCFRCMRVRARPQGRCMLSRS